MTPNAHRPRKSDATKAAILAAAREHFAASGFENATIRGIASSAQIDPTMVMRYFGNKERLFAAAAEFDLKLPDFSAAPRDRLGYGLVEHFLNRWEGDEGLMVLLRSAVTNDAAAERIRDIFANQVSMMIAKMRGESRAASSRRAGLVASQMLGIALCRYVLKLPPVVDLKRPDLVSRVGRTIQGYLFDD